MEIMNNADAIRFLSNGELAFYLYDRCGQGEYCHGIRSRETRACYYTEKQCVSCILKWLESKYDGHLELANFYEEEEHPDGKEDESKKDPGHAG